MKIIEGQKLYQCSYCNKRLLTKKGCYLHENQYCWHPKSPHQKNIVKKQALCEHKHTETQYRYIPGEAVKEPDYDLCIDCGKHV